MIGHFVRTCPDMDRDTATIAGGEMSFGSELKAPPLQRRDGVKIETVDVCACDVQCAAASKGLMSPSETGGVIPPQPTACVHAIHPSPSSQFSESLHAGASSINIPTSGVINAGESKRVNLMVGPTHFPKILPTPSIFSSTHPIVAPFTESQPSFQVSTHPVSVCHTNTYTL